jgi:hypothetical protein
MYRIWYAASVGEKPKTPTGIDVQSETVEKQGKWVPVIFFHTDAGREPVRDWLKGLALIRGSEANRRGYQD